MSAVTTATTLPAGTPVIEMDTDTARSVAGGDLFVLGNSEAEILADFGTAVALIDAGAKEAFVVVRIVAG